MARKDKETPVDAVEMPAVDPWTAPLPTSLVDAGASATPEPIPEPTPVSAAPALVTVRLDTPGVVALGKFEAGRNYDVAPDLAERLIARGFTKVEG